MKLKANNKYIYLKPNDKKFPLLSQDLFYVCIRGQAGQTLTSWEFRQARNLELVGMRSARRKHPPPHILYIFRGEERKAE